MPRAWPRPTILHAWMLLTVTSALAASTAAQGQTAPLTLEEAERRAVAASAALRAAEARVRREEALRQQSQRYPDPDMNIDTSSFLHGEGWRETIVSLQQRIPWHGKRGLAADEADERIAAARADVETARLDLVLRVRESFYRLVTADRILDLNRQNLEAAQGIRQAVDARVQAGDAAPFEELKAAVEVSRAESDVRQVQGEIDAERVVFNLLLGLPASEATTLQATDVGAAPGQMAELANLVEQADAAQPELQARRHAARAAGFAAERARLEPRPDIGVGPAFGNDQGQALVGIGVSLRLPLWNRGRGLIAAAEADRDVALADAESAALSVSSLVADAYGRYRSASRLKLLYEEGLLAQADSLVDMTYKSYEGGASGILDLLDARRTAIAVKEEYYRATLDAAVAAARLARAIGAEGAPR